MGISNQQLSFFAKYIEEHTGIVYVESNFYQLEDRIEKIQKIMGYESFDVLWKICQVGISGSLKEILLDSSTNNETYFFRDKNIFEAVEMYCVPSLIKQRPNSLYKIWSAACSTGQESYSLSIIFSGIKQRNHSFKFKIWASDFSERVLEYAKLGTYTQAEVQRGLTESMLLAHFKAGHSGTWIVNPELKNNIYFSRINLLEPWPLEMGLFDIVFCRNILIYQSIENKRKIIKKIFEKMNPNGFLFLGGSESLFGLSDHFIQISIKGAVFYQKKN
jgi:chemotaxis protein methyltransferase CheR